MRHLHPKPMHFQETAPGISPNLCELLYRVERVFIAEHEPRTARPRLLRACSKGQTNALW